MFSVLSSLIDSLSRIGAPPVRPRRSDAFANVPVTDQFGRRIRFREDLIRGHAVIINTMFTVCRGSCPGTSETLQRLRAPLTRLFGNRVSILSISIDPQQDTPEVLRKYAAPYGAGEPSAEGECDWRFLTGTAENIESLRRSLGFYDLNAKIDSDISRHAALLLFGNDTTDRWATSPVQIRDGLIFEPLRRILGVTTAERFGIHHA